jgi:hypothetical protein
MMLRARQVERGLADVKQDTAQVIADTLARFTPKKSGRARANWNASLDRADESVQMEGPFRSSDETSADARKVIEQARPGQQIQITNALEYIDRLNRGSSRKAPAGFVERALRVGRQVAVEGRLFDRLKGDE